MKLSIIIPVYNVEKYIEECINSVVNIDITNYEIICINDGSTDNSLKKLQGIAEKKLNIKIINQENKGLSGARNTGIKNAKGKYVFFLDSDDFINKNCIEEVIKIVDKLNLDVISFNYLEYIEETSEKKIINDIADSQVLNGYEYYQFSKDNKLISMSCRFIFKRSFLEKNSLKFTEKLLYEDMDFFVKFIFKVNRIKFVNKKVLVYRIRNGSITNSKFNQKKMDSLEKLINIYLSVLSKHNTDIQIQMNDKRQYFMRQIIKGLIEDEKLKTNLKISEMLKIIVLKSSYISKLKSIILLTSLIFTKKKVNYS